MTMKGSTMSLKETLKTIVQSDGIHLTADQLATANNLQQGIATAADVAGDVLTQMAPTDDTPLVATWGEITLVALERLGSKVGASIPGILRSR